MPNSTRVSLKTGSPAGEKLDLVAVLLHEGEAAPGWVDEATGGQAARAVKLGDFKGKSKQTALLYADGGKPARVVLVGLGSAEKTKSADAAAEAIRRAVGTVVGLARKIEAKKLGVALGGERPQGATAEAYARTAAEAAVLADYAFEMHKSGQLDKDGEKKARARLDVVVFADKGLDAAVERGLALGEATNFARDLANEPGNYGTPTGLAAAARTAGRMAGFKVKVLEPADMKKLGMGALLGVAKGSEEPARFIQMEYSPKGKSKGGTVCLVGKGLTFDSGGISIKPAAGMEEMKFDKCGGCAVIGAMVAVARTKLPLKVIGLVPSTENMPSGAANKPGDVLTALNGKTIEVLNTDAEGRLILADALAYSERFKPDVIVDLATLTGAVTVALGDVRAGLMSNDDDLSRALQRAGDAAGEKVWPLPMDDEYGEHVKSEVADVKNLGKGRTAGTIAGAWFLKHFVPEGPAWAHLDIAGTAWTTSDPGKGYLGKGATGFGVRLVWEYLRQRSEGEAQP